jgi:hypothetical protein
MNPVNFNSSPNYRLSQDSPNPTQTQENSMFTLASSVETNKKREFSVMSSESIVGTNKRIKIDLESVGKASFLTEFLNYTAYLWKTFSFAHNDEGIVFNEHSHEHIYDGSDYLKKLVYWRKESILGKFIFRHLLWNQKTKK